MSTPTRRRTTAEILLQMGRAQYAMQDRFMCTSVAADFGSVYSYAGEQENCDGCGAPVHRDHRGRCEYCGRPA